MISYSYRHDHCESLPGTSQHGREHRWALHIMIVIPFIGLCASIRAG
jgi:hypothetical protein